jgi:hypothetical protein
VVARHETHDRKDEQSCASATDKAKKKITIEKIILSPKIHNIRHTTTGSGNRNRAMRGNLSFLSCFSLRKTQRAERANLCINHRQSDNEENNIITIESNHLSPKISTTR